MIKYQKNPRPKQKDIMEYPGKLFRGIPIYPIQKLTSPHIPVYKAIIHAYHLGQRH